MDKSSLDIISSTMPQPQAIGAIAATIGMAVSSSVLVAVGATQAATISSLDMPSTQAANSSLILAQSTTTAAGPDAATSSAEARFSCQIQDGEYTVMYNPERRPGEFYPWATPGDMGGGWSADRRCAEISRRLEEYRPDGLLELRTGVENGYDIVCATTEMNPSCRIVFTVPQGQDPTLTRDRVFENLAVANSGQSTTAVNTFTSGNDYQILEHLGQDLGITLPSLPGGSRSSAPRSTGIDLRPFLDPADGGTGARLQNSSPAQLDPSDFR